MFQRNSNIYSFYYFWATECTHQKSTVVYIYIAVKNLRTESLLFLFSKKDKFIFSNTFYKYPYLFFTLHVISVKYMVRDLEYISREHTDLRVIAARTHQGLSCRTHTHTHTQTHTHTVDEDSASSPAG